jgi:hypothetical protein
MDAGAKVTIGWFGFRAVLLKKPPIKCYRCHMRGHTQFRYPSTRDRSNCCLNCGKKGHKAEACRAPANCPECASRHRGSRHCMGSEACPPVSPRLAPTTARVREGASLPSGGSRSPSTTELPSELPSSPARPTKSGDKADGRRGDAATEKTVQQKASPSLLVMGSPSLSAAALSTRDVPSTSGGHLLGSVNNRGGLQRRNENGGGRVHLRPMGAYPLPPPRVHQGSHRSFRSLRAGRS